MTANIFISFAAQDRKVANTLCQALESRGFKCWISSRDILPGENFQIAIVRAIRKAKLMLLVFTANSNNSEEMNKELALASQQKLTVVPLRIEDVAPNDAFAYEFATRQWIDFFADWELAMGALASQIANVLGPDAPAEVIPAATVVTVATLAETVVRPPSADITAPVEATQPAPEIPEAEVHAVAEPAVHEPEGHDLAAPEPDLHEAEVAESVGEPPADAESAFHDDANHAAGHESQPNAHPAYEPAVGSPAAPVRKKGSPLPLIIGVLVLAVAAGLAAMFVLGKTAPATTTAASSAASSAATAASPTVTLAPAASTAASSAAPVATPAGTPPQAPAAAEAADTSAATAAAAAADGGDGQKTRRHSKGSSAAAPPLRATRSDIPY